MSRIEPRLIATFEWNMGGNQCAIFEDSNLVSEGVDVEDAATGRVRDAVEIPADAHHALVGDAPFELENRSIGCQWQRLQHRLLLSEGLVDDALRRGVHTRIGDRVEPMTELDIEIVEIAERASEEEVLADIAEWSLNLALGLRPIGPAGARLEAVMPRKINQAAVVDDQPIGILADDRRLHAIVEDLARYAADRFQGGNMAA
jgi:hypothetical protein